jgi:hypothetical protein
MEVFQFYQIYTQFKIDRGKAVIARKDVIMVGSDEGWGMEGLCRGRHPIWLLGTERASAIDWLEREPAAQIALTNSTSLSKCKHEASDSQFT